MQAVFGAGGGFRYGTDELGLNMLTTAVARYVESLGAPSQCTMAGIPFNVMTEPLTRAATSSLALDYLKAGYVVDVEGTLWLTHAEDLRAENQPLEGTHSRRQSDQIADQVAPRPLGAKACSLVNQKQSW